VEPQDQEPRDVRFDEAVLKLQGKPVRAIVVTRAGRGEALTVVPESAESYVRGLQTQVGAPFEARKVSADCTTLWNERRILVHGYAREQDGEIVVTFEIQLEVEVYAGVDFVGLKSLDRATVDGLLGLHVDRQVTRSEGDAMRKVLLARYRRDGFAFCGIALDDAPVDGAEAPPPPPPQPGQRTGAPLRVLKFLIDEGPKITVGAIRFLGNVSFPGDAVFGMFGTDGYLVRDARIASDPARGLINGEPWSREVLDEDLDRLRLFYRGRGFLDATVDVADVQFSSDRSTVDLTFVIVEGPRYTIRSVRVEHVDGTPGQALATPPLHPVAEVEAVLKAAPGQFYDHDRLQRDVQAIVDFYGRRGHPSRTFPGMRDVAKGCDVFPPSESYGVLAPEVDIVYQVSEGTPKRLRDIVIRGNRFTQDHVIRRRFRVHPGERIDMVEVRRSLRAIEQTRFFSDPASMSQPRLRLEPVPQEPDAVDIGLDVEDVPTGQLRWGFGISPGQGVSGSFTFNKSNFDLWKPPTSLNPITAFGEILDNKAFHGGGQNLGLLLAPGTRYSQFQLTWSEPDVFSLFENTWELRVSGRRQIRRLPDGYTQDILGADVGLSRNFSDHVQIGFAVREDSVEIDNLAPDATLLAFDAEGRTELRGVRLTGRYRDLDDPLFPTSGVEFGLAGDLVGGPLGGEESLTKVTHTTQVFVPLAENELGHRTVLHLEQFAGIANAYGGSDDVFLSERFYLGGQNMRGFDFRRAGPKQFGRPLGGEATWNGAVEIFFPLVATRLEGDVRDREILRWVLFTDFGLLGLDAGDDTFRELRASSGIGLRIVIPRLEIPITLDLGWPWLYEESDDRRQLFFSFSR
ncbi:MAG: BamA/TamA family outer membrane protein, partial [Planctomycetota bacterium]